MEVGYRASAVGSAAYVIGGVAPPPSLASLSPAFTQAAGAQFTLTVNGVNFASGSIVYWGASALTTTFVSTTQLRATAPASDIASAGIVSITVQTPGSNTSNTLEFEIDTAGPNTPPSFAPASITATAGGIATSKVTLPSSATNVSVQCLNLPAGAACSYSPTNGTLTFTTITSTPKGSYVITVVFTETLPGAAVALVLLPFLLGPLARLRKEKVIRWFVAVAAIAVLTFATSCGGGGGSSSSPPPPQTHQVSSSGAVTLTVQ